MIFDERVFFLITQHTHPVALFFLFFLNIVAIFFLRIVLNVVALVFTLVQVILLRMIEGVEDARIAQSVLALVGVELLTLVSRDRAPRDRMYERAGRDLR